MRHELNALTDLGPGWTEVPEPVRHGSRFSSRLNGGDAIRGDPSSLAGSPSMQVLENVLGTLQERSVTKSSTLLLVWDLIILTIGCMAYDLLG